MYGFPSSNALVFTCLLLRSMIVSTGQDAEISNRRRACLLHRHYAGKHFTCLRTITRWDVHTVQKIQQRLKFHYTFSFSARLVSSGIILEEMSGCLPGRIMCHLHWSLFNALRDHRGMALFQHPRHRQRTGGTAAMMESLTDGFYRPPLFANPLAIEPRSTGQTDWGTRVDVIQPIANQGLCNT